MRGCRWANVTRLNMLLRGPLKGGGRRVEDTEVPLKGDSTKFQVYWEDRRKYARYSRGVIDVSSLNCRLKLANVP